MTIPAAVTAAIDAARADLRAIGLPDDDAATLRLMTRRLLVTMAQVSAGHVRAQPVSVTEPRTRAEPIGVEVDLRKAGEG